LDIGSQLQQEDWPPDLQRQRRLHQISLPMFNSISNVVPVCFVCAAVSIVFHACVLRASCISCFVCFVRAVSCSVVQSLLCFVCFAQPSTSASRSCGRLRCCQLSRVVCVVIRVLLGVSCFVCGICAACTSDGEQGRGGCDVVLPGAACVRCCPLMRNMRVVCNGVESLSRSCIFSVAKQGQGQIHLIQRRLVLVDV
jgi:hypothetical protein